MVGEACSRKGTFRPDRGYVFLSGLRLASKLLSGSQYLAYFSPKFVKITTDEAGMHIRYLDNTKKQ
ncbi:hypothetical protein BYT27DRAFT_7199052 [Phlegmacium glaucopus]|nr:hypothetical protein BYT27DRAFT_7199052 [Phlegmacium glaucopus]